MVTRPNFRERQEPRFMKHLKDLLNSILGETTFELATGDSVSPVQLREIFERNLWDEELSRRARKAQPIVPKEELLALTNHLRTLLEDYIDPKSDSIGLALPAGPRTKLWIAQENGLFSIDWISTVEDIAKALLKGSAVLGTEQVAKLFSSWLQREPVKYRTTVLINSLHLSDPLVLAEGIRLESLPLATDSLPADVPRRQDMPASEYLGRPILSIESTASPPLFRPSTDQFSQNVQALTEQDVSVATVCEALSLQSNSYFDAAFYWNDYQELWAFSLSDENFYWSVGNARVKKRPVPIGSRTISRTGVTILLPKSESLTLDTTESQFCLTLKALKGKNAKGIRVAIERWIVSKDWERNLVDSFIDLRIALESLYLKGIGSDKDRGEMSYRLSLYGAWHLGGCPEKRKEIFKTLREAYNMASKAVHGSDLKDTPENQELLSEAQDLCRRGILKVLREGPPPDKNDMILGVESDEKSV